MQIHALSLPFQAPYHWDAILGFLEARAIPGVEAVSERRYLRSIAIDEQGARRHAVIAVEHEGASALHLTIHGASQESVPSIEARVRQIFDLDAKPDEIEAV